MLNTWNTTNTSWQTTPQVHFAIKEKKTSIQQILETDMTRDRNMKRIENYLPTLEKFIKQCVESKSKVLLDLCAWKWILADDIQDKYNAWKDNTNEYIKVWRADILWAEQRQTDRSKPIWWRINMKIDINKLPKWLSNTYSMFGLQYIHNAPDSIENIRNKLKPWCSAYLQFPEWLWSKKLLNEFIKKNKENNVVVYVDDANPSFKSVIFKTRKETENDPSLDIPGYQSKTNIPLYRANSEKKVKNSELFYHFFSDNDPEYKEIETMSQTN